MSRLHEFLDRRQRVPFRWGANDCALFAADAVLEQTGKDPAEGLRGQWGDERQALALIARLGGLEAIATSALGDPLPEPLRAQMGDVGLVQWNSRECLAVCNGPAWVLPCTRGLGLLPLDCARLAWRVARG